MKDTVKIDGQKTYLGCFDLNSRKLEEWVKLQQRKGYDIRIVDGALQFDSTKLGLIFSGNIINEGQHDLENLSIINKTKAQYGSENVITLPGNNELNKVRFRFLEKSSLLPFLKRVQKEIEALPTKYNQPAEEEQYFARSGKDRNPTHWWVDDGHIPLINYLRCIFLLYKKNLAKHDPTNNISDLFKGILSSELSPQISDTQLELLMTDPELPEPTKALEWFTRLANQATHQQSAQLVLLQYLLTHTMAAPNAFENRRKELARQKNGEKERAFTGVSDEEVLDSFLGMMRPKGLLNDYLSNTNGLMVQVGNTLVTHGTLNNDNFKLSNLTFAYPIKGDPPKKPEKPGREVFDWWRSLLGNGNINFDKSDFKTKLGERFSAQDLKSSVNHIYKGCIDALTVDTKTLADSMTTNPYSIEASKLYLLDELALPASARKGFSPVTSNHVDIDNENLHERFKKSNIIRVMGGHQPHLYPMVRTSKNGPIEMICGDTSLYDRHNNTFSCANLVFLSYGTSHVEFLRWRSEDNSLTAWTSAQKKVDGTWVLDKDPTHFYGRSITLKSALNDEDKLLIKGLSTDDLVIIGYQNKGEGKFLLQQTNNLKNKREEELTILVPKRVVAFNLPGLPKIPMPDKSKQYMAVIPPIPAATTEVQVAPADNSGVKHSTKSVFTPLPREERPDNGSASKENKAAGATEKTGASTATPEPTTSPAVNGDGKKAAADKPTASRSSSSASLLSSTGALLSGLAGRGSTTLSDVDKNGELDTKKEEKGHPALAAS